MTNLNARGERILLDLQRQEENRLFLEKNKDQISRMVEGMKNDKMLKQNRAEWGYE